MKRCLIRFSVLFIAIAAIWTVSGIAWGEVVLFNDTFDTSVPSGDVNFEIADRTSGTYGGAGGTTYSSLGNAGQINVGEVDSGNEVLRLGGGGGSTYYSGAWLGHNFNGDDSKGGLDITIRANPGVTVAPYYYWMGLTIGDSGVGTNWTWSNRGLFMGMRGGAHLPGEDPISALSPCQMTAKEKGTTITLPNWSSDAAGNQYHTFLFKIRGVGDDNPFDGSGAFNVKLYVDGDTTAVWDYTTTSTSWDNNYIGIMADTSNVNAAKFDSITISNPVPEPSAIALLACGLLGLLAYAWRKRK